MFLENKLNQVLKEQEKQSRRVRRDKKATVADKWYNILPRNYYEVICSLDEEDLDLLLRCLRSLSMHAKEEIWNYIPNAELAEILKKNRSMNATIFEQMSDQRKAILFNDKLRMSDCCEVFNQSKPQQKLQIVDIFSIESLSDFFKALTTEGEETFLYFLQELYSAEDVEEEKQAIFLKIANLPAEVLAKIFQEADADVEREILRYMTEEAKQELCRNFHGDVYILLEETDFALLDYLEEFPRWNFDEAEMQDFFCNLEEREVNIKKALSVEWLQTIYVSVKDCRIREKILFQYLNCHDMLNLYGQLPVTDKMEMLEIMTGRKAAGQYDNDKKFYMLQNVNYILEETEKSSGLNWFEELLLKDLRSDKK